MASLTGPKSNWASAVTVQPKDAGYPTGKTPATERIQPVEGASIPANRNIVR